MNYHQILQVVGEALFAAVVAFGFTYYQTQDIKAAITAAAIAAIAKSAPSAIGGPSTPSIPSHK